MADDERPIIVKKVKKAAHGHHGGAWKVAYADFVTAMMAFFLMLWLLNVTTEEQRAGIANYFEPASIARSTSGSGGILGGLTIGQPGQQSAPSARFSLENAVPRHNEPQDDSNNINDGSSEEATDQDGNPENEFDFNFTGVIDQEDEDAATDQDRFEVTGVVDVDDLEQQEREALEAAEQRAQREALELAEQQARDEREAFEELKAQLEEQIANNPELAQLADSLVIEITTDGLKIDLTDQEDFSMFPLGSANLSDRSAQLVQLVAGKVADLPQKLEIIGHTDSTPFIGGGRYGNWELSADRANASRRALLQSGIDPARIDTVTGKADTDPFVPDNTRDPRNRRISIILLSDHPLPPEIQARLNSG